MHKRDLRPAKTATCILIVMLLAVAANRDDVVQAQRLATVSITICSNGTQRQLRTAQTTVEAALSKAGVILGPLDEVTPAKTERPRDGMRIEVIQIRDAMESVGEPIAYDSVMTFTNSLRPGKVRVDKPGVRGEKLVRYLVRYRDGKPINRKVLGAQVVREPVDEVVTIGSSGRYTSRGQFRSRKILKMSASAYDPGPRSCGKYATGRTSCGMKAGYGVVATDPKVIPMHTKLYIEGYGHAVAGDRGSAIKGNRIDLGFNTYREAIRFGRKQVIVHILE